MDDLAPLDLECVAVADLEGVLEPESLLDTEGDSEGERLELRELVCVRVCEGVPVWVRDELRVACEDFVCVRVGFAVCVLDEEDV